MDSTDHLDAPTCPRCAHYYITHDTTFRYGCRALGFKSRGQPARDVLAASGEPCRYFEPRPERSDRRQGTPAK